MVDMKYNGLKVDEGEALSTLESVKTVAEVHSPFNGEIIESNQDVKF